MPLIVKPSLGTVAAVANGAQPASAMALSRSTSPLAIIGPIIGGGCSARARACSSSSSDRSPYPSLRRQRVSASNKQKAARRSSTRGDAGAAGPEQHVEKRRSSAWKNRAGVGVSLLAQLLELGGVERHVKRRLCNGCNTREARKVAAHRRRGHGAEARRRASRLTRD